MDSVLKINHPQDTTVDDDVFFFESEHLALRGNKSYSNLLRTIALLQAQRIRVHQQIMRLEETRDSYLSNPQLLIEKIQNSEPFIEPNYTLTLNLPKLPISSQRFLNEISRNASTPQLPLDGDDHQVKASKKSQSFWTNEEQQRLEQLLMEYPPEEVEMRRFSKIAKALTNRTPQQVFSRVQKYFQKLRDAGMPVPGRIPKHRRAGLNKPKFSIRRSTFFPAQNISLSMPDDENELHDFPNRGTLPIKTEATSDRTEGDEAENKRTNQLKINILTSIYNEKLHLNSGYNPDPLAPKCSECNTTSITETRWRCISCYCFLNLCGDCLADQIITNRFEHLLHDVIESREE